MPSQVPSGGEQCRLGKPDRELFEAALAKGFQDVAGLEDVKELGELRTHSKLGPLVFMERRHLADRHVTLDFKRSDDPPRPRYRG